MAEQNRGDDKVAVPGGRGAYPLEQTASMLNDRLGLYLSPEQQKGLATGLLVGAALAAAIVTWSIAGAVRDAR